MLDSSVDVTQRNVVVDLLLGWSLLVQSLVRRCAKIELFLYVIQNLIYMHSIQLGKI